MRDIGTMGESYFKLICASVGLTANSSEIDKTGWDFMIEFPLEYNSESNADLIPSPIECRIQIKSTDNSSRKIQIKLSNLLMLAKSHTPSFIYFIEFDKKETPQNTFLLHLDKELIFKILKKSREISIVDDVKKLNKITMTINYDDTCRLNISDGAFLKEKIKEHIKIGYANYTTEKINYLKNVGYDKGRVSLSFTTSGTDDIINLIDSSLGIIKKPIISNLVAVDTRFGLKSKKPFINVDNGILQIGKVEPISYGRLVFKESKLSSPLVFNCKLYNSPFNFFVDNSLIKIKIENEFFTLLINIFSGKANYQFNFDSISMPLYTLRDAIQLMVLITTSNKKITVQLDFDDFPKTSFHINCKNEKNNFKNELNAIENIIFITERFKIPNDIQTSINQIQQQRMECRNLVNYIKAKKSDINLSFSIDGDTPSTHQKICVLKIVKSNILDRRITLILSFVGNIELINEDRYKLNITKKKIEYELATSNSDEISNADIDELVEEISLKYIKANTAIMKL
ncbi:TPA: hypothetical protein ACLMQJ_002215 [Yersinia enterocolitica]|uniref:hypothetical protein n=1 Tax=Yersinia enterocolitica TaxID=630 RepID=UPI0039F8AD88